MQLFSTTRSKAIPIFFVTKNDLKGWISSQSEKTKCWLNLLKFSGAQGEICLVPEKNGNLGKVVVGGSDPMEVWDTGSLAMKLPTVVSLLPKRTSCSTGRVPDHCGR